MCGRFSRAIQKEEVHKPFQIRGEHKQRQQDEMEGKQLHRNVIGHVEREDLNHVGQANQAAERRGAWEY